MDLWKLGLVVLLVAAIIGGLYWLDTTFVQKVRESGDQAQQYLNPNNPQSAVGAWRIVTAPFGPLLGDGMALVLTVGAWSIGALLLLRVLRWANGS